MKKLILLTALFVSSQVMAISRVEMLVEYMLQDPEIRGQIRQNPKADMMKWVLNQGFIHSWLEKRGYESNRQKQFIRPELEQARDIVAQKLGSTSSTSSSGQTTTTTTTTAPTKISTIQKPLVSELEEDIDILLAPKPTGLPSSSTSLRQQQTVTPLKTSTTPAMTSRVPALVEYILQNSELLGYIKQNPKFDMSRLASFQNNTIWPLLEKMGYEDIYKNIRQNPFSTKELEQARDIVAQKLGNVSGASSSGQTTTTSRGKSFSEF